MTLKNLTIQIHKGS